MATINTKTDWILLAEQTVPKLAAYADQNGCTFDEREAVELLELRSYETLHRRFEKLWGDLPDRPEIRFQPFFDLCDLCSEIWVFEEDGRTDLH